MTGVLELLLHLPEALPLEHGLFADSLLVRKEEQFEVMSNKTIEIAALGRPLHPGMLYDRRSDTFIPGVTLWDEDDIEKAMRVKPQPCTSFNFTASDSISEKSSLLDVSASLKASFLGGLVEVGGSASFLKDRVSSTHQCRVTMQYKQTTEFKQLTMALLGHMKYIEVFDQQTATHVVTAVMYGAEAFMVFNQTACDYKDNQEIKGNLDVMIKKIPTIEISGSGKVVMTDEEKKKVNEFSCTFHGDFELKQNPSNYEEAVLVYKDLPNLLGEKSENAVPVRVWLYPLKALDSKAAQLGREVKMQQILSLEALMEHLHEAKMRANDLISQCETIRVVAIKEKLKEFKGKLEKYNVPFQQNLGKVLTAIRAGTEEEQKLADILKFHEESSFTQTKMNKWMDEKASEIGVLKAYINTLHKIPIVPPGPELDTLRLDPQVSLLQIFTFTSLNYKEPYLSNLSECLASADFSKMEDISVARLYSFKDEMMAFNRHTNGEAVQPWYNDELIKARMRKSINVMKRFLNQTINPSLKTAISYIPDSIYTGASIYTYEDGQLKSRGLEAN
ncbi:hypothetical protein AAFF_G00102350 [Aldrovandia affinis]|uniref:SNTX thioredoxin-like domain-containing protein n=1 Tax=Aldrovandia affinis TaxID=143900 RepID=A0AAD7WCA0_9TELE|nr:hypothetical protein AAFF_G00102350 [Aldrovandia affinis]